MPAAIYTGILTNLPNNTVNGMFKHPYLNGVFKTIFLITAVFFLLQNSSAQKKYGVMAGVGTSALYKFPFSPVDYNRYSSTTSLWGGLTADFVLNQNGIHLFTSAIYKSRGYKYSMQNQTGANGTIQDSGFTQNIKYVDVNATLLKKFATGEASNFFAGTGPSVSIFTAGKEDIEVNYFGNTIPAVSYTKNKLTAGNAAGAYKPLFISWNFAIGFELDKFNIWFNAGIPLSDYYQDATKGVKHKLKTFGINVGYTLFSQNTGERKEKKEQRKEERKERNLPVPVVVIDSLADDDGDGILNKDDRCPGHKGVARYFGCPVPDTDGDGINDEDDKCPAVAGTAANNGCPPVFEDSVKQTQKDTAYFTVYFEPAKSILRSEAYKTLTEVVNKLKANSKLMVIFRGHTDNVGSVEANNKRSLERANVCADYVASFYIDRGRLLISSFGNKKPAADLSDPLVQWKNRRVEICIFEKNE